MTVSLDRPEIVVSKKSKRLHNAEYKLNKLIQAYSTMNLGRVQQLTGRTIGTAYVRQVSCWTTFILIQ